MQCKVICNFNAIFIFISILIKIVFWRYYIKIDWFELFLLLLLLLIFLLLILLLLLLC
eukprot:UN06744